MRWLHALTCLARHDFQLIGSENFVCMVLYSCPRHNEKSYKNTSTFISMFQISSIHTINQRGNRDVLDKSLHKTLFATKIAAFLHCRISDQSLFLLGKNKLYKFSSSIFGAGELKFSKESHAKFSFI